jgi:flavin reductase (DIM6/NTAB) family NADH-FMN oxidoreductase RutF
MHLTKTEIENKNRIERLNIINSITGIKPGNLIGTRSEKYGTNLAVFSSVVHLGSHPALLGFILRPQGEVPRNTFENISQNGYYTINHIHKDFIQNAHYTSAKFKRHVSEFEKCQLTEMYLDNFPAPYVKESHIKMGMRFLESIPIKANNTIMVIGQIEHLYFPDEAKTAEGYIDMEKTGSVGIGGLNNYYQLKKTGTFPFARPEELPDFNVDPS